MIRLSPGRWALAVAVLAAATALAGCGDGDGDASEEPTATTVVTPSSSPSTTTTEGDSDTTAPTPSTTTPASTELTEPPEGQGGPVSTPTSPEGPVAGAPVAAGSGCNPGADTLPDGMWFGTVTEMRPDAVVFDLACWFTGDHATAAATEDGKESPPPNDFHIRNDNPALRTVPVGAAATVERLEDLGGVAAVASTYPEWTALRSGTDPRPPAWLTVSGGEVTTIAEQYIP